jgi:type IV secretion system protein VirD4
MALDFGLNGTTILTICAALVVVAWVGYHFLSERHYAHETGSAYGEASWAKFRNLKQAGLFNAEGIVLGRLNGKLLRCKTDKHLLTLAPNRAGKGVSAIIPNLLIWPGSLLVIDPKGENAAVTVRRRRAMGQKVHVLDPWGITGLEGARFNPLLELVPNSTDLAEDAALLADSLVMPGSKADDEFWNGEARSLIAGLVMHIVTTELPEDRHLGTLRAMLTLGEAEFAELLDDMIDNHAAGGLVARTARRLIQKTDRERSGVISTAQAQTHFLDSPRMTHVLGASSFDLTDLKAAATTIYLVLPTDRLATHGRWLRLVVGLAITALTRDRSTPEHPVLFVLDEFAALGRLQTIETAIGLLAGYGVLLWPILQDLSQLQDLYPKRWRSFLANAGVVQAFGINDISTADYLSKMLGQRTVTVRQHGRSGESDRTRGSENYAVTGRPLLMPQEIMRLPPEKQLVLLTGKPPILADRVRYFEDREFEGMFDRNPMMRELGVNQQRNLR